MQIYCRKFAMSLINNSSRQALTNTIISTTIETLMIWSVECQYFFRFANDANIVHVICHDTCLTNHNAIPEMVYTHCHPVILFPACPLCPVQIIIDWAVLIIIPRWHFVFRVCINGVATRAIFQIFIEILTTHFWGSKDSQSVNTSRRDVDSHFNI